MEDKNTNRRNLTTEFITTIGRSIIRIPLLLVTMCLIVIVIFLLLTGAFIDPSASTGYKYNLNTLAGLIITTTCLWGVLHRTRREIVKLYSVITRYRTMRHEKVRIERLIKSDEAQDNQNATLLQYAEDESYKELANGKR
jgi:hypothetical protein